MLRSLGNGECVFRDLDGRAGRIMVDLISDDLRRYLDTNPTRARSAQAPVRARPGLGGPGGPAPNGSRGITANGAHSTPHTAPDRPDAIQAPIT